MYWRGQIAPHDGDGSSDERRLFEDGIRAVLILDFPMLLQALPKDSGAPYLWLGPCWKLCKATIQSQKMKQKWCNLLENWAMLKIVICTLLFVTVTRIA